MHLPGTPTYIIFEEYLFFWTLYTRFFQAIERGEHITTISDKAENLRDSVGLSDIGFLITTF